MVSLLAMQQSMSRHPLYQHGAEPVAETLGRGCAGLGATGFDAAQLGTEIDC